MYLIAQHESIDTKRPNDELLSVEGPYGPRDRYYEAGPGFLAGWVSGMFVREICPGMYGESSEPILM